MTKTTHDRVTGLLPWLLNGSLDADERREVEDHLARCDACRGELEATRAAFRLHTTHLPARALTAYAEDPRAQRYSLGSGATVERSLVEAHLVHCPSCREELELVRESREALEGESRGGGVVPFRPATPSVDAPGTAGAPRRGWALALAASLLVACVAAGGWFLAGQQRDAALERVARIEERLAAAADTGDGAAAAPVRPAVSAAELEAARRRSEELARTVSALEEQVAGMESQVERLRSASTAPRSGPYLAPEPLGAGEVLRGDDGEMAAEAVVSGEGLFNLAPSVPPQLLAGRDGVSYRLLAADGTELHGGQIPVYENELGPYVSLFVSTAGLPAGPVTLVLSDGEGGEIARYGFRVER